MDLPVKEIIRWCKHCGCRFDYTKGGYESHLGGFFCSIECTKGEDDRYFTVYGMVAEQRQGQAGLFEAI